MLTGDHRAAAEGIGRAVGIPPAAVHHQLRPEDKLAHVQGLAKEAPEPGLGGLLMVGAGSTMPRRWRRPLWGWPLQARPPRPLFPQPTSYLLQVRRSMVLGRAALTLGGTP